MTPWLLLATACQPSAPAEPLPAATADSHASGWPPCDPPALDGLLTVGQDGEAVPWSEGTPVDLVRGPQGGWHVEVGGHVHTDAPAVMAMVTAQAIDGRELIAGPELRSVPLREPASCDGILVARGVFDPLALEGSTLCSLDGQSITVSLTVDGDGTTLERTHHNPIVIRGAGRAFCDALH